MSEDKASASQIGRSVVDFDTEAALRDALLTVTPQGKAKNDWMLPVSDPEAQEQTVDEEVARLQTLKSYMLLDTESEEAFDKLTQEASEIFGVPTSLVSLIDLGRQVLWSNTGAGDIKETTRAAAFCSHTILNKKGIVVVEDTNEDKRFKDNEFGLRFYAGAPLISPEGHKLGTFCVEGPDPRKFSKEDQQKLKEYAAKTMTLMVERRKNLRDKLAGAAASNGHLRHAAVATNLGDTMFLNGDAATAMQLFQESIQTIMSEADASGTGKPCDERHEKMADLLKKLSEESATHDQVKKGVMDQVKGLIKASPGAKLVTPTQQENSGLKPISGIPGLFNPVTKLRGVSAPRPLPPLVFSETFRIDLSKTQDSLAGETIFPLDERPFTVSISEVSKATLFNMGLLHYQWCRLDTALQFFHLAASVSHKISPVQFDPVDLTAAGNLAQIYLLLRKPDEAMEMLQQTLKRANDTLSTIYKSIPVKNVLDDEVGEEALVADLSDSNDEPARKTRRLRRKIARTLLDIGHVHFFNNDLDAALASCKEALSLVDEHMTGVTRAAAWFNISMILHLKGENEEALSCLEKFLEEAPKHLDKEHIQISDALQLKGEILLDGGKLVECIQPLQEALRMRRVSFGETSGILVETLAALGKAQLGLDQVDQGIKSLEECLGIEQAANESDTLTFEAAQCLLDLARGYQVKGDLQVALTKYLSVIEWSRTFFGPRHPFTARIATILGKLNGQLDEEDEARKFLQEAADILPAA